MESDRLRFVKLTKQNVENLHTILLETSNCQYTCFPHMHLGYNEKLLKPYFYSKNRYSFLIFFKETNTCIGFISFHSFLTFHKTAQITWIITSEHQNKGYITEAAHFLLRYFFIHFPFNRVEAQVHIHNAYCIKVMRKLGFTKEGYLRQNFNIGGLLYDSYLFSILKQDLL